MLKRKTLQKIVALKAVALCIWYIVSAGVFIVLAVPFVLPQHHLTQLIPECEWQRQFNKPCAFCGMSSAFYAISKGRFTEANRLNPLSTVLYSLFVMNTFLAIISCYPGIRFAKTAFLTGELL